MKDLFSISETAKICNLIETKSKKPQNYILRYWEKEFKEIKARTEFLLNVGLNYLALNRSSKSLSGGEAQRIRLATQIGSQLVGVLYLSLIHI